MGDLSKNIDIEKLVSYCDDLVAVLKDKRDAEILTQCFSDAKTLRSSCDTDLGKAKSSLQDYERKLDPCKEKIEAARSEVVTDEELDLLLKQLEEEQKKENLLSEELRAITNEINDMERTRISVQERNQTLRKREQDELNAQRTLSMLASVTNIIPNFFEPSKISGHIVDREKKEAKKFEIDSTQRSALDTCDDIWKMIAP